MAGKGVLKNSKNPRGGNAQSGFTKTFRNQDLCSREPTSLISLSSFDPGGVRIWEQRSQ